MKGIIDMKDFIYAAKVKGFAEKGNIIHSEDMFIQIYYKFTMYKILLIVM